MITPVSSGGPGERLLRIDEAEAFPGLRLTGELDVLTAPALQRALEPLVSRGGVVTLELDGLEFIDSAGLRVFVTALKDLEGRGQLVLRGPRRGVRRTLELTGLDRAPGVEVVD